MKTIRPGIVMPNGAVVYPTGFEWLLAFAISGCQWAVDALPEAIERHTREDIERWAGSGI